MQDRGFTFASIPFCLAYPEELTDTLDPLLRDIGRTGPSRDEKAIEILRGGSGEFYQIISATRESGRITGKARLIDELRSFIRAEIASAPAPGLLVEAAAFAVGNHAILFPGRRRVDPHLLAALLDSHNCRYRTDTLVHIDGADCAYLPLPPAVDPDDRDAIGPLLEERIDTRLAGSRLMHLILAPDAVAPADSAGPPALLVFSHHQPGTGLSLTPLPPGRAAALLLGSLARQDRDDFRRAAALCREVPALRLGYGDAGQLRHLGPALAYLSEKNGSPEELKKLLASFQPKHAISPQNMPFSSAEPTPAPAAIPEATPPGPKKTLTIGMATYDDYDGVYFTVQAIRLYHPEVTDDSEILVIDNNPAGPAAQALKDLEHIVANYRYVPFGGRGGTSVRDLVFRQANADFVLCLDGHVLVEPGALRRLIIYFRDHPDSRDLLQGPMYAENLKSLHTHFEPKWSAGMYGRWGIDTRARDTDAPPFDISMQGLGLFGCRRDAWVGFNPRFRGFGGEEGYIHEKFRQRGGRTLCLPFLRWLHRFARPAGVPYRVDWHDRIFNYLVGLDELGLDDGPLRDHFREHLGEEAAAQILAQVEAEMRAPFFYFDAIYCITPDTAGPRLEKMRKRFTALGIEARVRMFRAVAAPDDRRVGSALSHRAVIAEAQLQGLDNVLIVEDEALFLDDTLAILTSSVDELRQRRWNLFYLGGDRRGQACRPVDGCAHLGVPTELTGAPGVAYARSVFETILTDLPDSPEGMTSLLEARRGLAHCLSGIDRQFICEPSVSTTIALLPREPEELRHRFILGEKTV